MSKRLLIALTIILILVNVYIIAYFSVEERRLARLYAVVSYTILFLLLNGFSISKIIFGVLLLFIVSDVLGFYFENPTVSKFIYLSRTAGYFLLMLSVFKRVKIEKVKPHVFIIFATVILLNLYLLYTLVESATKNTNDIVEYGLIFLYGAAIVLVTFMAANYNLRYNSNRSTYFFYAVLAFVFSDLSWFCAYFLKYTGLFHADIIFYYLGLLSIIYYSINTKESEDVLLV